MCSKQGNICKMINNTIEGESLLSLTLHIKIDFLGSLYQVFLFVCLSKNIILKRKISSIKSFTNFWFIEGFVGKKNTTAFQLIFILKSKNYKGEVRKNGDNSELRITMKTNNWAKLNISHLMFQTEWGAREGLLLSPKTGINLFPWLT